MRFRPLPTLFPGSHSFEVGGIAQRYHVHGSGPVCVAHPGGPGINWAYLRTPALEEHLTMVYVEPIGTGASGRLPSHPHGYTRERYSRFLELLINNLGVCRVHLLGHAHGALIAAHHAVHRPERLAGVVLYEGAPATGHGYADGTGHESEQAVAGRTAGPVLAASEAVPCVSSLDEDLTPDTIDDRASLRGLTVPAMVILGRNDVSSGSEWGREVAEVIPGARLLVLKDGGHSAHVDETASFTRAIRDFVQDVPAVRTAGRTVVATGRSAHSPTARRARG
ncbi:alpha/beta fold hydrolase [Streptomyces sp. NPDC057428]|uniref:alpha/beta fold hydrolase n=1 Tax=Streptomyces sp. NPDC057428 TaxID=3346129 RepID=UPI0036A60A95